jgi:hypothetical protein
MMFQIIDERQLEINEIAMEDVFDLIPLMPIIKVGGIYAFISFEIFGKIIVHPVAVGLTIVMVEFMKWFIDIYNE